jgi:flagellin
MIANNSLKMADNKLSASLERLSSGYKINHAKDNAAGLAIARRMNAQVRGLSIAEQDAKDGESVVEIADGALAEVHDMLQRMNELAVKSANGTMSDDDRKTIQDEITELQNEITRIGETTEYNSQKLFDGTFDLKAYSNKTDIKVNYYSDEVNTGKYEVSLVDITFDERGEVALTQATKATLKRTDVTPQKDIPVSVSGDIDQIILTGENGVEVRLDISAHVVKGTDPATGKTTYNFADIKDNPDTDDVNEALQLDMTGIGAMTLQIGANEGQTIDLRIPQLSLLQIGIDKTSVATYDGALRAIEEVDKAIASVSEMRSRLGAYQNRLQHTQTNLATSQENVTAAYSRIMDTDMAEEMTDYSNLQVVTQAATSILAQANERPSQVLQLLQ